MIISEIFYGVKCNRCGEQYEDDEHSFWSDEDNAIENAIESEWMEDKGKHYCTNCYDFDEETEERTAKPDFPEHVKNLRKFFEKMIVGSERNTTEGDNHFTVSKSLYKRQKLETFEENYIKEMLGDKFISLECKKHERYTQFYCYVMVAR